MPTASAPRRPADEQVAFVSSPRFVEHDTGPHHPERPDRLRAIHRALRQAGMLASPDPFPDFRIDLGALPQGPRLRELEPRPAEMQWLRTCHTQAMLDRSEAVCSAGGGVLDQGDTPVCGVSFELAKLSCGALLTACDAVATGANRRAFSCARPPGHHAEPGAAMGFCLLSNVAIAARYLQQKHNLARIAVIDFDVHHGNGTQACLEDDPTAFMVSIHQHPRTCYPGSGYDWEVGVGNGRGFTLNIPMVPGSDDADYFKAFDEVILPRVADFRPDAVLISAGFDGHLDDPLAGMSLSEAGFAGMTRRIVDLADQVCDGRVISALEGGYHLRALARSVVAHLTELAK